MSTSSSASLEGNNNITGENVELQDVSVDVDNNNAVEYHRIQTTNSVEKLDHSTFDKSVDEVPKTNVYIDEEISDDLSEVKFSSRAPPIQLEWHNLEFKVKVRPNPPPALTGKERFAFTFKNMFKKVDKQILYPMNGFVQPGSVLAIMGPSGAGKTSLLNILAQRVSPTAGEVRANGSKISKSFRSLSAFVQQDDVLMGNLTVRETLRYAAMLRLDSSIPVKEKMRRVDAIMTELGLAKAADTVVGIPGITKGISGGERKRLCIAIELLTEPSVLFLDEPTTGLDSKTSLNVMKTIIKLAKHGRTVILTIHQPRSNIYKLFDKLLLMQHNTLLNQGYICPIEYNPADYVMDLITENAAITGDNAVRKKKQEERIEGILSHYSNNVKVNIPSIDNLDKNLKRFSSYNASWIFQFLVIMVRAFTNIVRDRKLTIARIFQNVAMAILVGLIFLRKTYSYKDVQDRIGVLFFVLLNQAMNALFSSLTMVADEKPVYLRERGAKMYRVSSYYLGRSLAEIPNIFFFPVLFSVITYWMVGLNPAVDRFFMFLLIVSVLCLCAQSLGMLMAVLIPNTPAVYALAPVVITVLMLFGGFYKNVDNMPNFLIWIYWTSPFHFGYEAFVLNEFEGVTFECPPIPQFCTFPTGSAVIENFAMTGRLSNVWINLGFLLALAFVYRVLSYFGLRYLVKPKGG
ncbi:hypothetical protein ABK040_012622 [Willaertia magna]